MASVGSVTSTSAGAEMLNFLKGKRVEGNNSHAPKMPEPVRVSISETAKLLAAKHEVK